MKCISLFVCFFISLQSMIVPSYEVLISNIESKVDTIHEDRASFLSLKCRDIAMDVTSKKTDLRIEMDKQEKCVDELERRYKQKKNYYELKKMEYGLELQTIQRNNSILYPYKIQKNLSLYFDEYRNVEVEYLKHKKQFDKNQNTLLLYDEYLERLHDFIETLDNVEKVEVLPYHTLGEYKWKELGYDYPLAGIDPPTKERVENANRILETAKYLKK